MVKPFEGEGTIEGGESKEEVGCEDRRDREKDIIKVVDHESSSNVGDLEI